MNEQVMAMICICVTQLGFFGTCGWIAYLMFKNGGK